MKYVRLRSIHNDTVDLKDIHKARLIPLSNKTRIAIAYRNLDDLFCIGCDYSNKQIAKEDYSRLVYAANRYNLPWWKKLFTDRRHKERNKDGSIY